MRKHLLIAAAGTGGHVMPGIAVAKELQARGWVVSWVGTQQGMEKRLVERQGIPFVGLNFQGLRGKGIKTMLFGGFKLLSSIFKSKALLNRQKVDVVFSTGGYVAVPVCLAAGLQKVPYVLMNSDADLLLSIKMLQSNASGVMCGFDGDAAKKVAEKAVVTGNPVRKEIVGLDDVERRYEGREGNLNLLVFGGSLGAKVFNETVPQALSLIKPEDRPSVVHQCGVAAVEEVKQRYQKLGVDAHVVPFIDDMSLAYEKCDLVLARAGAISVSELMVAGVPSILVPLVVKTTSHQVGNARYMQKQGASIYLDQKKLTPKSLSEILTSLDRKKLVSMALKAKSLGKPEAAKTVADFIEHITKDKL